MGMIVSNLLQERDRWPLWIPVCLGCGVGVYFGLPAEPSFWGLCGLTGMGIALAVISRRYLTPIWTACLAVVLLCGGVLVA